MSETVFTDRKIRALKVENGRVDYYDSSFNHGGSFGIRVSSSGKKTFFISYRFKGLRRRYQLGTYPALSLSQAREKAIQVLASLLDDIDPSDLRKKRKTASTFAELAEEYLAIRSLDGPNQKKIAKNTLRDYRSMLKRDILPVIGALRCEDVTPELILSLLDTVSIKRNAPVLANRTFELVRQIYNWGMSRLLVKNNPSFGLKKPGREKKGERVLSTEEIKKFWAATEDEEESIRAIFRLLLLTGARPQEIKSMRWDFIDGNKWTLPAHKSKNRRKHESPLSELSLQEIGRLSTQNTSDFLFPGRNGLKPVENLKRGLARVKTKMGVTDWTFRDLRRTCQTVMAQIGIDPHTIDRVLNHNIEGVRSHYDYYSYYPERKAALSKWDSWLQSLIYGETSKVVALSNYR